MKAIKRFLGVFAWLLSLIIGLVSLVIFYLVMMFTMFSIANILKTPKLHS